MRRVASTVELRCRAQVWERGVWIRSSQCQFRAKAERIIGTGGGAKERLAVCGIHNKGSDPGAYSRMDGDSYAEPVREFLR